MEKSGTLEEKAKKKKKKTLKAKDAGCAKTSCKHTSLFHKIRQGL